jgi:hypothetical protein
VHEEEWSAMPTIRTQLIATVPDGWNWKESLTLLSDQGDANVIFSSEPLEEGVDLERYALMQGELLGKEFPGYRELAFEPMRMLGHRHGYLRRFQWNPPDGAEVTQIQLYCVEGERGYTATATTVATNFPAVEPVLTDILLRLALDSIDERAAVSAPASE